jgi:ADP-heptose:LPS heptosyltransferase
MKILIIRFSSIGDIVLTTPVIRCLKKQLGADIHFLTKRNFEKIVQSNPYVDKVWSIERDAGEILPQLKIEKYDYLIDLHKNLRSFQIKRALKVLSFSFNKLNIEKWLMVNLKINRLPYNHIVDRNLEAVAPLGVKNDNEGLDYFIPKEDEIDINSLMVKYSFNISDRKYIALVIGAAHATKRLPVEKLIEICNKIDLPILILGGKEDMTNGDIINSKSIGYALDLCGKLNLNQSASVIKQAYKVITHDTGLMHIAAAFRKDIISVWGNTIPEFGMYPYMPEGSNSINEMIEVRGLSCRPCSKIGYNKCPKGHFKCMQMIDTDEVVEFAKE